MSWRSQILWLPLLFAVGVNADPQVEFPDRSTGYFIGDMILQRINLSSISDSVELPDLAVEERIDTFLYRSSIEETTIDQSNWLEISYQIVNAPQQTIALSLPSITLNNSAEEVVIPAWEFTLAPLTAAGDDWTPLPDRSALSVLKPRSDKTLKLSLAALCATLVLWLVWWLVRHFKDSHTLPFARAKRIVNRVSKAERDSDPESWIALHRAFNDVAGKTISVSTMPELFRKAPWLNKYKDQISAFYASSSARFYQQTEFEGVPVTELCTSLYREELRHAKASRSAKPSSRR